MEKTALKVFSFVLAIGLVYFVPQNAYAQKTPAGKGTTVITVGSDNDSDAGLKVTKTFEFTSGGVIIDADGSDVNYKVYEKTKSSTSWSQTADGVIKVTDDNNIQICKTSDAVTSVRVEIMVDCDDCAEVTRVETCK